MPWNFKYWSPNKQKTKNYQLNFLFVASIEPSDFVLLETLTLANRFLVLSMSDLKETCWLYLYRFSFKSTHFPYLRFCCFHKKEEEWRWITEWESGGPRCATISGGLLLICWYILHLLCLFSPLDSGWWGRQQTGLSPGYESVADTM